MNIQHYNFKTVNELMECMQTLRSTYPHICYVIDKPSKQLIIEVSPSDSYQKKICKLIENAGGVKVEN